MVPFYVVRPKVPPYWLVPFLRGLGLEVDDVISGDLESWVTFRYQACGIEAHRDIDEWRFFAEACRQEDLRSLKHLLSRSEGYMGYLWVWKGFFDG